LDLELLRHRGPDAQGEWRSLDERVWFGHTRLAILDLSAAGAQPMVDPQTGNVIIFNGELYNHLRLRRELHGRQPQWVGSSDTETLLAAYRSWGADLLERLKGMFAFAIYDASQESLFLARDRLGIKPLYYSSKRGSFLAASETRALPDILRTKVEPERLASYLRWGACPEKDLLFSGIEMLPAGHWMTVSSLGRTELKRYWPAPRPIRTFTHDPARHTRKLLETAVQEHLLADVPVASFLSGGIDSSIITALAARSVSGKLQTFSVGFKQGTFDETKIAREVAERYGTDHHRIELDDEETIELVREAVGKMDLPSVDALNTYIVSKKVAEQGIKVALSGLGGDELFGGYPSFRDVPRMKLISHLPASLRRGLAIFGQLGKRVAELPIGGATELATWRRRFWTDAMLVRAHLPAPAASAELNPDLPDDFSKISWAELTRYMRHLLLRDSDQMSMAVSLELRVPFLDHELVEFVLGLPGSQKRCNRTTKALLIESCRDLLPPSVYQRPKMGFGLPMDHWMRGPLQSFVEDGLREAGPRAGLSEDFLKCLYGQFKGRKLHWTRIWSVVVLGHYVRRVGKLESVPNRTEAEVCEFSDLSVR
jgi:asparagine synthase (glutamine-hydrolysing)